MTALSNEILKVGIHYLPHCNLFKVHRILLIFVWPSAPLYVAFSSSSIYKVRGHCGLMPKGLQREQEFLSSCYIGFWFYHILCVSEKHIIHRCSNEELKKKYWTSCQECYCWTRVLLLYDCRFKWTGCR